ncbi:protein FAR1-RELATED SEQUENCE 7-like [Silene latifolia]|uniref:protein FAR1-RELATED SEQUENCE 7-like n=1 Tax=Silene latifolia TaxID=37657 RepID=UPI003D77E547
MGGRYPVCMITDEDVGIEEGMKLAWKDKVQHRYCMWHILKKLPEKSEDVEPPEFEERWTTLVESHGLSDNEWLKEKYNNRNMWVPSYFCDLFLGDIIDQVRNKTYKVGFKKDDVSVVCTCKKFERHGILCQHALCVFKDRGIQKVPSDYLLSRWSKLANCQLIVDPNGQLLVDCTSMDVQKNKVGELWSELFTCVALVEQSSGHCDELLRILREFKERVKNAPDESGNTGIAKVKDKNAEIGMLLGTSIRSEIKVLPPRQCKNKGSGKRLISQRERAGELNKKPLRKCRACGEMTNHDSRNYD